MTSIGPASRLPRLEVYIGVEILELGINKCAYNFVYFAMTVWNDDTENTLKAESVHVNILCSYTVTENTLKAESVHVNILCSQM